MERGLGAFSGRPVPEGPGRPPGVQRPETRTPEWLFPSCQDSLPLKPDASHFRVATKKLNSLSTLPGARGKEGTEARERAEDRLALARQ